MAKYCHNIDRRLLPVKLHYLMFFSALGCALPFRTVFAKQLGISATAVGVIFCAVPFLKIITNPLFGFIIDYFKQFRLTLSVTMILVAASHLAMIFVPPKMLQTLDRTNITESDIDSDLTYSCLNSTLNSSVCDPRLVLDTKYEAPDASVLESKSFSCEILCFVPEKVTAISNEEEVQFRNVNMKFEFEIIAKINSCGVDVELENVRASTSFHGSWNSTPIDVNESSVNKLQPKTLIPENCSMVVNQTEPLPSKKLDKEKTFTRKNHSSALSVLEDLKHEGDNVKKKRDHSSNRYFVHKEYAINYSSLEFYSENFLNVKFVCRTKMCLLNNGQSKLNSTKFADEENEFLSLQFWSLFMLVAVSSFLFSAIIFIMDAVCYELLQDRRDRYGWQRLWGTIGWGLGALAGGFFNQIVTKDSEEIDYAPGFYMLTILSFIDIIIICQIKITDIKYSSHIWKDVCFLFSNIAIVYNVVVVYFIGILSGFIWNYQFWFMEEIGSSQVLLGLSQTIDGIFELPCFIVSGWIIKKIGHHHCNNVTLVCFAIRYLCFVFIYNPWWTLAVGVFHGPTFGLFYASMTMYAKNEAPVGTEATVQSLLCLSFEGLGVATGSILGGIGLDKYGSRMSFLYAAGLSFILLMINIVKGILFRTEKHTKHCEKFQP